MNTHKRLEFKSQGGRFSVTACFVRYRKTWDVSVIDLAQHCNADRHRKYMDKSGVRKLLAEVLG